jgi:quercetin dioxygenase-like cupin family protein
MPPVPNLTTDVLLRSEQTGGHVSVTEIVVPPHSAGPPLHTHDFDEAFYMLEGELIFQVDDALVTKGAGQLSFAARNVAHTLANHSDAPARYVLVCTPAGFERHWARIAADAAGVEPPRGRCSRSPRSPSSARRSRPRRESTARATTRSS